MSDVDSKFDVHLWQWPNVLAIDAVLIALLWHAVFALFTSTNTHFATASVLGLSIWLTYTADRLFDVAKRPMSQLHSVRHRFTKQHAKRLWKIWFGILAVNVGIALASLTIHQLANGTVLLLFCLLYTGLNQRLSRRFFPKELCVALIYAAGVVVFLLPAENIQLPCAFLVLLCLLNCLIISANEQPIDAAMGVHSIAQLLPKLPVVIYIICLSLPGLLDKQWLLPFGISLAALAAVHLLRERLAIESFRVLADGALLIGPLITLLTVSAQKNL